MAFLNVSLDTLALPWDETLDIKKMKVAPMGAEIINFSEFADKRDLALVDDSGAIAGWVPFAKLADAILQTWKKTAAFYETLLKTIDDAATVVDGAGRIVSWNPRSEELYHCPEKNVIGKPITRFFEEESLVLMSTLKEGKSVKKHYNQPQSDVHVLINSAPVMIGETTIGGISIERNISDIVKLNEELSSTTAYIQHLESKFEAKRPNDPFYKIKGRSASLQSAIKLAKKVAVTDASVLITGESGVGKELFAQGIHQASGRSGSPFVAVNCGAIPSALFESELFGYDRGAFTGAAREGKKGRIDAAKGGTLFLDEIGEMPLELQVKLLRVLQEKQFFRVGGNKPIPVELRVIAATNRDLEKMIADGLFRPDLYYRLNVVSITIPPLRDRIEDIPELVQVYLKDFSLKYKKPVPVLDPEVMVLFLKYSWQGNIRQLRNTVERMMILADDDVITKDLLPDDFAKGVGAGSELPAMGNTAAFTGESEKEKLGRALKKTYGNKSAAAKLLGISRVTLYHRLKKYDLLAEEAVWKKPDT